ncbi:MAG: hypothetical protein ABIG89_01970 [Candidatus Woesearchaeota archaeon]
MAEESIVDILKRNEKAVESIALNYHQMHSEAHTTALKRMREEGLIEFNDDTQEYQFSALKDSAKRDKLHEYMMEDFDARLAKTVAGWDNLEEIRKDTHRRRIYGLTSEGLKKTIDRHKDNYNTQTHLRSQEDSFKRIMNELNTSLAGMLNDRKHVMPILKDYLKIDDEHIEKMKDQIEERPDYLGQLYMIKKQGQDINDKDFLESLEFYRK